MSALHRFTFLAALALGVFPVAVPAGEAPAPSAAAEASGKKRLDDTARKYGVQTQLESEKALAEAQQQLDAAARRVAELSSQMGRRFNVRIGNDGIEFSPPRVLLGINVDRASGREGARVMDVSPGGAAAEAGIKPGDIVTGIADLDLTKDSEPSSALVEKMALLQPDQKVKIAVLRDGRKLNFDVAPRPAPQDVFIRRQDTPGGRGPGNPGSQGQGGGPRAEVRQFPALPGIPAQPGGPGAGSPDRSRVYLERTLENLRGNTGGQRGAGERIQVLPELFGGDETRFGGAELASLSERLGGYFGVKSGVLVVRAGVDSQFKLQDGDVILAVDGREITSAQQAGRILRSYQPGEKLKLKVQRDRKVQDLEIAAPGGRRPN